MEQYNESKLKQDKQNVRETSLSSEKVSEIREASAGWEDKYHASKKEITVLKETNSVLKEENAALKEENDDLKKQVAFFKKQFFGQKTEKTEVVLEKTEQLSFFNEAEQEADISYKNAETETEVAAHKRKSRRTHHDMLENLPVEEVLHRAEDRTCPECGTEMQSVGREFARDELVYVPARLFCRKHYIEVLKCPSCGTDETKDALHSDVPAPVFRKAKAPSPLVPRSYCSPELIAHIIFEKYCQAVPLYRQEKEFKALGVELSRTAMANWVIYVAKTIAKPLWEQMKAELLKNTVIHADETPVQVLHEKDKEATSESRMWVYAAPKASGRSIILFEYCTSRSGSHAAKFLGNYDGYLVCDGYDGYNKLTNVKRCGCFAHVRRKFVDALPTEKELLPTSQAAKGVEWCNKLFALEREFESLSPEDKIKQRQERSKPVLDGLYLWLDSINPAGGTKLAKAVQYAKNEKQYLCRFLDHPDVPIDNNRAENAIRPFVIGRKNWLFSDSAEGAEASAVLYSLAATAAANGINAEEYFTKLFNPSLESKKPWN